MLSTLPKFSSDGDDSRTPAFAAYIGHIVSPIDEETYDDIVHGALVVDRKGNIVAVGSWDKLKEQWQEKAALFDFGERLILPGLIDLHIHLPQVTQIGKSGQTLLGWLQKYIFPAEARFADSDHAAKIAHWFFDELARNGTTLAAVFTTIHKNACDHAFKIAAEKGSRVIMGKVMMDRNAPDELSERTDASLDDADRLCKQWHGHDNGRLLYAFTPRFAVTATEQLLEGVSRLWKQHQGSYVHTHLAESEEECQFVSKQFPQCRSYVDVYQSHGLLGERSIYAHSIHIDDEDVRNLKTTRSSLAHCPSSNFFLKSGAFPYARVKEAEVLFGLGSDVAAGPQMSIFGVMKDANYMQGNYWISPAELFYRATLGGARAAHLGDKVGSLTPGKEADFIVVNPLRKTSIADNILKHPTDEILSSLVFLGDDRLVEATFVRGKCIFHADDNHPVGDQEMTVGVKTTSKLP